MSFRRGDVIIVAGGAGFAGKPRPAVIVQDDVFAELSTVVTLLFTTQEGGDPILRPEYSPSPENGLREPSRLMVHAPTTVRLSDVGGKIGQMTAGEMAEIDEKLLLLLGFARSRA